MSFYVYIVASAPYGTLYIGQTSDLPRRIFEHREKAVPGFTAKYGCTRLVWFESFELRENAFRRERQMKEWKRTWKIELIEATNPRWDDLYEDLNNLLGF
ncbi:GIY-YIG nuclease family protein [Phenylobacterium sp.]|uniref:GIY-YIG nuclease family protein n=1 Tax=Phenylobacterium sp. TaxID=1871053 RepID=UPI002C0322C6|nr:GIY-YIG nuclease family protein [Phenylobacterium sp.]HLZ75798.1 GIY-YIG nuclease family protein [Phenylobacterium sp.]